MIASKLSEYSAGIEGACLIRGIRINSIYIVLFDILFVLTLILRRRTGLPASLNSIISSLSLHFLRSPV